MEKQQALPENYTRQIMDLEGDKDNGWDVRQFSGPYGVRRDANERLTKEQAEQRFRQNELPKAHGYVRSLGVQMPMGWEAALTSLTYNSGPKWINSGLGQAVKAGDWETARHLFLQYNKSDGAYNKGLDRRRTQEMAWISGGDNPEFAAAPQNGSQPQTAQKPLPATSVASLESDSGYGAGSPSKMPLGPLGQEMGGASSPDVQRALLRNQGLRGNPSALKLSESAAPYSGQSPIASYLARPARVAALGDTQEDPTKRPQFAGGGAVSSRSRFEYPRPEPLATGGIADGHPEQFAMQEQQGVLHAGPLKSQVPGRTDQLPISVARGAFVIPADVVSALGEGNTEAGNNILDQMFSAHGSTDALRPRSSNTHRFAQGGVVPIIAAGGEYVVDPESVANIGGGDMEAGHQIMDQFVKNVRAKTIKLLQSLPPPAQ